MADFLRINVGWLCVLFIGWASSVQAHYEPINWVSANDTAIAHLKLQLRLAQHDTSRIALINQLATQYQLAGKPDSAFTLLKASLEMAYKTERALDLGRTHYQFGLYYAHQVLYPQSINAYQRAIRLIQQGGKPQEAAEVMYTLARLNRDHGDFVKAVEQTTQLLRYADQTRAYKRVGAAHALLYEIHTELGDKKSAYDDLQAIVKAAHEHAYPTDYYLAYANSGEWYDAQADYTQAFTYWKKALLIAQQLQQPVMVVDIYCGMADNLIKQEKLQEAELFLDKALEEAQRDKRISIDRIHSVLARLREKQNRLGEAHQLSLQVLAHTRKNFPSSSEENLETLLHIQQKQGKFQEALETLIELKALSDSLKEIKKIRAISAIESQLALEKQKKDIALLKKNAAIQGLEMERSRQQQILYIGMTIALIIVLLLIGWYSWQARSRVRQLKQHQAEIMTQAEHLQELNNLKDRLFSLIGHDLRTPIMNLKNSLHRLDVNRLSPERFMKQAAGLKRTVDSLYSTMDNLLHWSAMQREGLFTKPEAVDLPTLVAEALELLEPTVLQKNITVEIGTGHAIAWVDEIQVQIVIRNILHNALKFTPYGGFIWISFQQSTSETRLRISDTGRGILVANQQQFKQGTSQVGTMGETGTGLGLLVSEEFMKGNGGRLEITSEIGKGTAVQLVFLVADNVLAPVV